MTAAKKATLISKIDVSRAIETLLAAGMIWSPDAPSDMAAITDAYYYALDDFSKDQLDRGVQQIIRDTRGEPKPWIPAANKVRWAIEQLDRAERPVAKRKLGTFVERVFATDPLGPLVRGYGEQENADYPSPEAMRCPEPNCGCEAVGVWVPAVAFGGPTAGWGSRFVWAHVALEQKMMRVQDGLPFERRR